MSEEIHKESFENFEIFKKIDINGNFIAWISARLKQQLYPESTYFYQKGDPIDSFYLAIRGVGAFVMSDLQNEMFSIVDPVMFTAGTRTKRFKDRVSCQQYFGAEDIVINMAALVHDELRKPHEFCFKKNGFRAANRRYFSVQSIKASEVLILSANDIDHMKMDFPISSQKFFKRILQQTKDLLKDHRYALQHYRGNSKFSALRFRTRGRSSRNLSELNMSSVFMMFQDR